MSIRTILKSLSNTCHRQKDDISVHRIEAFEELEDIER